MDPTGQPSHGDVGGSDAQTPQHPSTSHIPVRLFSSPSVAQRTENLGGHEMPPMHMLDHAHEGLQSESHEDIERIERQVLLQKRGQDVYESNTTNYQLVVETTKD